MQTFKQWALTTMPESILAETFRKIEVTKKNDNQKSQEKINNANNSK